MPRSHTTSSTESGGAAANADAPFSSFWHWNKQLVKDGHALESAKLLLPHRNNFHCQFCLARIERDAKFLPYQARFPSLDSYINYLHDTDKGYSMVCSNCYGEQFPAEPDLTRPHSYAPWALSHEQQVQALRFQAKRLLTVAAKYHAIDTRELDRIDGYTLKQVVALLNHYFNGIQRDQVERDFQRPEEYAGTLHIAMREILYIDFYALLLMIQRKRKASPVLDFSDIKGNGLLGVMQSVWFYKKRSNFLKDKLQQMYHEFDSEASFLMPLLSINYCLYQIAQSAYADDFNSTYRETKRNIHRLAQNGALGSDARDTIQLYLTCVFKEVNIAHYGHPELGSIIILPAVVRFDTIDLPPKSLSRNERNFLCPVCFKPLDTGGQIPVTEFRWSNAIKKTCHSHCVKRALQQGLRPTQPMTIELSEEQQKNNLINLLKNLFAACQPILNEVVRYPVTEPREVVARPTTPTGPRPDGMLVPGAPDSDTVSLASSLVSSTAGSSHHSSARRKKFKPQFNPPHVVPESLPEPDDKNSEEYVAYCERNAEIAKANLANAKAKTEFEQRREQMQAAKAQRDADAKDWRNYTTEFRKFERYQQEQQAYEAFITAKGLLENYKDLAQRLHAFETEQLFDILAFFHLGTITHDMQTHFGDYIQFVKNPRDIFQTVLLKILLESLAAFNFIHEHLSKAGGDIIQRDIWLLQHTNLARDWSRFLRNPEREIGTWLQTFLVNFNQNDPRSIVEIMQLRRIANIVGAEIVKHDHRLTQHWQDYLELETTRMPGYGVEGFPSADGLFNLWHYYVYGLPPCSDQLHALRRLTAAVPDEWLGLVHREDDVHAGAIVAAQRQGNRCLRTAFGPSWGARTTRWLLELAAAGGAFFYFGDKPQHQDTASFAPGYGPPSGAIQPQRSWTEIETLAIAGALLVLFIILEIIVGCLIRPQAEEGYALLPNNGQAVSPRRQARGAGINGDGGAHEHV